MLKRFFPILGSLLIFLAGAAGCGQTTESAFGDPETFLSEHVEYSDETYACTLLPWYSSAEDVQSLLSSYTKTVDEDDFKIYWGEGLLPDQTPVRERAALGFRTENGTSELVSISLMYFVEETGEGRVRELMDSMKEQVKPWEEEEGVVLTGNEDDTMYQLYQSDTGSYIALYCYPDLSEDRGEEFPEVSWERYSGVMIDLWYPQPRISFE